MKLFDAKSNAIPTFSLPIKQLLTVSNITFDDLMETPTCFVLPPWYIKPPDILFDLVDLKKKRSYKSTSVQTTFLGN